MTTTPTRAPARPTRIQARSANGNTMPREARRSRRANNVARWMVLKKKTKKNKSRAERERG